HVAEPVREAERAACGRGSAGAGARSGRRRFTCGSRRRGCPSALARRPAGGEERRNPCQGAALQEAASSQIPRERPLWIGHAIGSSWIATVSIAGAASSVAFGAATTNVWSGDHDNRTSSPGLNSEP